MGKIKTYFKAFLATFVFFTIVSTTSCLSSKKSLEKTTDNTEITETKHDSSTVIVKSEEIKDRIVVNVPKSDNEEVKKLIDAMLQQMNTSKSSGSNSYVSRYDQENQRLIIEYIIGQSVNKNVVSDKDTKTEKTFEENVNEYVKNFKIPWWFYAFLIIFFLVKAIEIIKLFRPGLF